MVSFEEVSKWVSFTGSESKVSVDKEEAVKLLWTLDSGKKIYRVFFSLVPPLKVQSTKKLI